MEVSSNDWASGLLWALDEGSGNSPLRFPVGPTFFQIGSDLGDVR